MKRAFVLGAGLGKRLRPLTNSLPKPLVPVWNRPLITHAFDHLLAAGAADELVVNAHHAPEAYAVAFPGHHYEGRPLHWSHEPILLDTAGGLAQVAAMLMDQPWAVIYNGDILSDLPLHKIIRAHDRSGAEVTLGLRSSGPLTNIGFDPANGRVLDVRAALGVNAPMQTQFTGVYVVGPPFLRRLETGRIESVAAVWQRMLAAGAPVHGVLVDEGLWLDLGTIGSYLEAHRLLADPAQQGAGQCFPRYARGETRGMEDALGPRICGEVQPGAILDPSTVCGPEANVGPGAVLERCVVWPGAVVPAGVKLRDAVVLPDGTVVA